MKATQRATECKCGERSRLGAWIQYHLWLDLLLDIYMSLCTEAGFCPLQLLTLWLPELLN